MTDSMMPTVLTDMKATAWKTATKTQHLRPLMYRALCIKPTRRCEKYHYNTDDVLYHV